MKARAQLELKLMRGVGTNKKRGGGITFLIILLFWFLYLVPSTIFKLIKQKHLIQNPNTGKNVAHGKGSEHGAKKKNSSVFRIFTVKQQECS